METIFWETGGKSDTGVPGGTLFSRAKKDPPEIPGRSVIRSCFHVNAKLAHCHDNITFAGYSEALKLIQFPMQKRDCFRCPWQPVLGAVPADDVICPGGKLQMFQWDFPEFAPEGAFRRLRIDLSCFRLQLLGTRLQFLDFFMDRAVQFLFLLRIAWSYSVCAVCNSCRAFA